MLIFPSVLLITFLIVYGLEYDVGVTGDAEENEVSSDGSVKVNMINTMDEAVSIIWYKGLDFSFIMDIDAGESSIMTTFVGHKFYCIRSDDEDSKRFFDFEIEYNQNEIYIADDSMFSVDFSMLDNSHSNSHSNNDPNHPVIRTHPRVRSLDKRSTSVGAKFKSLYPKTLDIWFDDGADGTPQGILGPGKETTTNTYEGHEFYFTEAGNKKKVVERIKITTKVSMMWSL